MAKGDMETARAMINVLKRRHGNLLHKEENVFEGMDMAHRKVGPPALTPEQFAAFVRGADAKGLLSVSGIVLYVFETLARVEDVASKVTVEYFRPPDHPDEILVVQNKVHQQSWFDLYNDKHNFLYCIEANPVWSGVFSQVFLERKPKNVSFLFGSADEFVGCIRADVALICTHSDVAGMKLVGQQFAPIVIDVYGELIDANPQAFDRYARDARQSA